MESQIVFGHFNTLFRCVKNVRIDGRLAFVRDLANGNAHSSLQQFNFDLEGVLRIQDELELVSLDRLVHLKVHTAVMMQQLKV